MSALAMLAQWQQLLYAPEVMHGIALSLIEYQP